MISPILLRTVKIGHNVVQIHFDDFSVKYKYLYFITLLPTKLLVYLFCGEVKVTRLISKSFKQFWPFSILFDCFRIKKFIFTPQIKKEEEKSKVKKKRLTVCQIVRIISSAKWLFEASLSSKWVYAIIYQFIAERNC